MLYCPGIKDPFERLRGITTPRFSPAFRAPSVLLMLL